MILILKTGSTIDNIKVYNGDFEDWITEKMKLSKSEYHVHAAGNYENLPPELNYSGIIITGSPLMVTDLELSTSKVSDWLLDKQENGMPILGICFGHQLLNVINGGSVNYIESGILIGLTTTHLTSTGKKDELLRGLPATFEVFKTHRQCVYELADSAKILSTNNLGIIDAIKFSSKTWGVQFHPEFSPNVMKLYIQEEKESLIAEGFDVDELLKSIVNNDFGEKILKNFKEITNNA